jgi:hypothetical protein
MAAKKPALAGKALKLSDLGGFVTKPEGTGLCGVGTTL